MKFLIHKKEKNSENFEDGKKMLTQYMNGPLELTQFNVSGDSLDANDLVATIEEDDEKEKKDKEKDKASKGQNRNEFEQGRNRLMYLLEKVEDSAHVMDVPTRFLLHSGKLFQYRYGILLPKLARPTVKKKCSSDREKLLQNF